MPPPCPALLPPPPHQAFPRLVSEALVAPCACSKPPLVWKRPADAVPLRRKKNEWRFLDSIMVDTRGKGDLLRLDVATQEMRGLIRKDPRIIQKLHK